MWTCNNCKAISNDDTKEICFECMTPRKMGYRQIKPPSPISNIQKQFLESDTEVKAKSEQQKKKELSKNMFSNDSDKQSGSSSIGVIQGYVLIGLICVLIGLFAWSLLKPSPKYAYKVLNVQAQFNNKDTTTESATAQLNIADLKSTSVNLKDEELTILGNEGWELVETFLEVETTHPNYGSSSYVTGLQPNVRTQRVVMIFRKLL